MIIKTIASFWGENMLGYYSLDIICSLKLTDFLELRSWKTVRVSEQIMSADKYPSIFSPQMEAIVYLDWHRYPILLVAIRYQDRFWWCLSNLLGLMQTLSNRV